AVEREKGIPVSTGQVFLEAEHTVRRRVAIDSRAVCGRPIIVDRVRSESDAFTRIVRRGIPCAGVCARLGSGESRRADAPFERILRVQVRKVAHAGDLLLGLGESGFAPLGSCARTSPALRAGSRTA